jgi:hypothetical protein
MFPCHMVGLRAVFGSAAHWSLSCRYQHSRGYMNMWSHHPRIFCSTQEDSNAGSKVKTCCFDFVSCFCNRFLMQMASSIPHTCWVLWSLVYIYTIYISLIANCPSMHPSIPHLPNGMLLRKTVHTTNVSLGQKTLVKYIFFCLKNHAQSVQKDLSPGKIIRVTTTMSTYPPHIYILITWKSQKMCSNRH